MIWMMAKLGKEAGLVAPKALITILIAYLTFRYEMLMFYPLAMLCVLYLFILANNVIVLRKL